MEKTTIANHTVESLCDADLTEPAGRSFQAATVVGLLNGTADGSHSVVFGPEKNLCLLLKGDILGIRPWCTEAVLVML
jgi:hypothetical protein